MNICVFMINLIISRVLRCSAVFRIFVTVFGKLRHDFRNRNCFEKKEDSRKECLRFVFENDRRKERNFPQTVPNVASALMPVEESRLQDRKQIRGASGVSPARPLRRSSQTGKESV